MGRTYVVFDVETPNSANDRISAIGVTVVEDGIITEDFYSLVNPQTYFDGFNIRLTGITPEMTRTQPCFEELWPRLEALFERGLIIAHNAPFDMGVLAKCLRAYGIFWRPRVGYACTCRMGRACYPGLENHRLNTLCYRAGVELNHHNAGSDSRAAAELLINYMEQGVEPERFARSYDLVRGKTMK